MKRWDTDRDIIDHFDGPGDPEPEVDELLDESKSILKRKAIQRGEKRCEECLRYHPGPGSICSVCQAEKRLEWLDRRR